MATEEIRQNFHRLIDTIADEQSLIELFSAAELYLEQQTILLDTEEPSLIDRLTKSLQQLEEGKLIPNDTVQREAKKWLGQ